MAILNLEFPSFEFHLKTNIIFGLNSFSKVGSQALKLGGSALIVSTSRTLRHNGILSQLQDHLLSQGIESWVTTDISPNPQVRQINALYQAYRNIKIDFVIGIGGGSSLDAAKAIAVLLGAKVERIDDFLLKNIEPPLTTLPVLAIPTTCSGSEVSAGAILTDKDSRFKGGIRGVAIIPRIALIDPLLSATLPEEITKISGFDVFTHAFESFMAQKSNPFSEMFSRESLRIIINVLPCLLKDLKDVSYRSQMSCASLMAGINLINVGTCLPHRLQYALGASNDVPHGLSLSMIYPYWLKRIRQAKLAKIQALRDILGNDPLDRIEQFLESLEMTQLIKDRYRICEDIKTVSSRVRGNLDNDPIYKEGIVEEIFTDMRDNKELICKPSF